MREKVCLITGATNGIGKVTALELAKQGATVIIVGRNAEKTERVVAEIQQVSGNPNVKKALADLSSLNDIRSLAEEFKRKYSRLDVLVNNAGAYYDKRYESVDGFEMTFALNHLSYFLLTNLLLDLLKSSAPARIINVSSDAHRFGGINFDDLQSQRKYSGFQVYGRSKLMNVLFTYELARRLEETGVTVNALHPGFVATGFSSNNQGLLSGMFNLLQRVIALSPEEGAKTTIYLASSPEVEGVTGKYFDKCKVVQSSKASYDETSQRRLWEISEALTGMSVSV